MFGLNRKAKERRDAAYWRAAYEDLVRQTGRDLNDGLGLDPRRKSGAREASHRQTCKACGRRDKFNFHVPDHVWSAVVPGQLDGRVVCLSCFDDLAREKDVPYATSISEIWFAGDAATLALSPTLALEAGAREGGR